MRISTKGRYGLRAILDLAVYGENNKPVLLSEISRREKIPQKYLSQIMSELIKAGFIKSIRGRKGGYLLNKPPKEIKVSSVLHALEGDFSVVECVADPLVCDRVSFCGTRDVWKTLSRKIEETLSSITLEELVQNQKKKFENPIYNI